MANAFDSLRNLLVSEVQGLHSRLDVRIREVEAEHRRCRKQLALAKERLGVAESSMIENAVPCQSVAPSMPASRRVSFVKADNGNANCLGMGNSLWSGSSPLFSSETSQSSNSIQAQIAMALQRTQEKALAPPRGITSRKPSEYNLIGATPIGNLAQSRIQSQRPSLTNGVIGSHSQSRIHSQRPSLTNGAAGPVDFNSLLPSACLQDQDHCRSTSPMPPCGSPPNLVITSPSGKPDAFRDPMSKRQSNESAKFSEMTSMESIQKSSPNDAGAAPAEESGGEKYPDRSHGSGTQQDEQSSMSLPGSISLKNMAHMNAAQRSSAERKQKMSDPEAGEGSMKTNIGIHEPNLHLHPADGATFSARHSQESYASVGSNHLQFRETQFQETTTENGSLRFEIRDAWAKTPDTSTHSLHRADTKTLQVMFGGDDLALESLSRPSFTRSRHSTMLSNTSQKWETLMLQPNSLFRFTWDILGIFFICYDALWLPMQFFDPPAMITSLILTWVTRFYWTADVPLNFFTSYITQHGAIETSPLKVSCRYLVTWAALDISIVAFDWASFAMDDADGGLGAARFVKAFKLLRALRMLKLMRLMKLPGVMHSLADEFSHKIRSEKLFLFSGILKILTFVVVFVHILACFFWYVGSSGGEQSWPNEYDVREADLVYQYMHSFHWSLAQVAGGNNQIVPQNLSEWTYAVIGLLVSWMLAASAVSIITTAMTRDSFFNIQGSMESVKLRKYLIEHKVSRRLISRLMKNAQYAVSERARNVTETNLELLKLVSEPLRAELHFEVHSPVLKEHAFFYYYNEIHAAAMRRICHSAIVQIKLSPGDILFSDGEVPDVPAMYFFISGTLKYWQGEYRPKWVRPGMWASEHSLWTNWMHHGYLRAACECNINALSATELAVIDARFLVNTHPAEQAHSHAGLYAIEFVKNLNEMAKNRIGLTDLACGDLDVQQMAEQAFGKALVSNMSTENRTGSMLSSLGGEDNKMNQFLQAIKAFAANKTGSSLSGWSRASRASRTSRGRSSESLKPFKSVASRRSGTVDRISEAPNDCDPPS